MDRIFYVVGRSGRFFVECLDTDAGLERVSVVGNSHGYLSAESAVRVRDAWRDGNGPGQRPPVGPLKAGDRIPVGFDPFGG